MHRLYGPLVVEPQKAICIESPQKLRRCKRPLTSADDYQSYAQQCLRWAEEANNEENRQALLAMARMWARLANQGQDTRVPPMPK